MPFGIPSENFHGGFGIPEDEMCVINYDDTDGELDDREYEAAAQEAHDNLVHSLVEAGGEIRELKEQGECLVGALKKTLKWLDYFLTTQRDDIYYEEANAERWAIECMLMDMGEDI